jgi:hypothetical protein
MAGRFVQVSSFGYLGVLKSGTFHARDRYAQGLSAILDRDNIVRLFLLI